MRKRFIIDVTSGFEGIFIMQPGAVAAFRPRSGGGQLLGANGRTIITDDSLVHGDDPASFFPGLYGSQHTGRSASQNQHISS